MSLGKIVWYDLTVPNADEIRDFYSSVAGWKFSEHPMGEYSDYEMKPKDSDETVAGICHARGTNASVPPVWMLYIIVENVQNSAEECVRLGGKIIDGPRMMGKQSFCVIQDPAGAMIGLIEQ